MESTVRDNSSAQSLPDRQQWSHYAFCQAHAAKTPPIPADCSPAKLHLHFRREQLDQADFVVRREKEAGRVTQGHCCAFAAGWLSLCGMLSSLEQQKSNQTATKIPAILSSLTSAQGRNKALSNSAWARKNSGKTPALLKRTGLGIAGMPRSSPPWRTTVPFMFIATLFYF